MKIEVSMEEVLFGVVGTVLGGLMVTLLANNHSLESQLKAISIIDEPLQQAIEKTTRADTNATNAIARLRQVQREVDAANAQAQKLLADLKGSELFTKGASAMDELREIAKREAVKTAEESLLREFFSVFSKEHVSQGAANLLDFSSIESQSGTGWNGTNLFIAPVSGFYEFSLSFLKDTMQQDGTSDDVFLTVYLNGKPTYIMAWSGQDSGKRSFASAQGVLELKETDEVQVLARSDGNFKRVVRNTIFSGKLIAPKRI